MNQRLIFYHSPIRRMGWSKLAKFLTIWGMSALVALMLLPLSGADCEISPNSDSSSIEGFRACTANEAGMGIAIALGGVLLIMLIVLALDAISLHRYLALTVTSTGLISEFSRFPRPVVGWEEIESMRLYEAAPHADREQPHCYLTVTVHSSNGLHDSEVKELAWRHYPLVPDADRVAILLPLERISDTSNMRISPATMLSRIQQTFAPQIIQNEIAVSVTPLPL